MDLQQIKYFLAIVDFGTFMAAAEQVHVSQPTLSAGIRKLEQSLNVQLFNRGSRAATLTSAGELFLSHARPAYNQLLSVKSKLSVEQETISLGILNSIPMDHIAEIIRLHRLTHPHVLIEVVVANDEELFEMLKTKKLDMAFTSNQPVAKRFTPIFNEKLMVVVSAQHPFANSKEIELKQLDGQPFIERTKCESWADVHNEFHRQGISPKTVYRSESDESVLSLVAAGLGVSIMPVRNSPYEVAFVQIKDLHIVRHIGIVISPTIPARHIQDFHETVLRKFS